MSIEISISSSDVIHYIFLFTAAFIGGYIGGYIGAKMGYLLVCIPQQRDIRERDNIERRMDKELKDHGIPYLKDKVEHRDHRLDD